MYDCSSERLRFSTPHKFVVSAWTNKLVNAVLAAYRIAETTYGKHHCLHFLGGPSNFAKWMDAHLAPSRIEEASPPVEHLVGQFASGMTSLLGKLVEGWTSLAGSNVDDVARHFTSFVGAPTHHPTNRCGWYDYNSSQEQHDTQEDSFVGGLGAMDAGPPKGADGHDVTGHVTHPSHASARLNKGVPTAIGISSTRSSPRASLSNTGDPVLLEEIRKQNRKIKKTKSRPTKATKKDQLERFHSKLVTSSNGDIHVPLANKPVATTSNTATSSDGSKHSSMPAVEVNTTTGAIGISDAQLSGSDKSVSTRIAEVVLTLPLMRDASNILSGRSASDEVSALDLIFNKEDSCSCGMDFTHGAVGTALPMKEGVVAKIPHQRTSIVPTEAPFAEAAPILDQRTSKVRTRSPIAEAAPTKVSRAGLPPRRCPRKNLMKASIAAEVVKSSPGMEFVPASSLFPPFKENKSMGMKEVGISEVARGKQESTDGAACSQPMIHVNFGVSCSPNKKTHKKDVIEITGSSARPTNKTDSRGTLDSEMFVQLSPLDSANQFMWNPSETQERHPWILAHQ
ncbi:hypothetical protein ZWY2020_048125, partial [Hordeum vulgare]